MNFWKGLSMSANTNAVKFNGNIYVYNPSGASQEVAGVEVKPKKYAVMTRAQSALAKQFNTPLIFEDHPQFPHPFAVCVPKH